MRLVDASLPFKVVYALYHHEYLGYLISAHVVQVLPNQQLSLVHQGIHPGSMEQFSARLSEEDRELIHILEEITPAAVVKQFKGNPRELLAFFTSKFEGQKKELALTYVKRRMARILPMLVGKDVYEMANDGYPAHKSIEVVGETASILFHFRREETQTIYFPTIKLKDEKIEFRHKGARLICYQPAWMLFQDQLFTFEQPLDGRKLKPFLNKHNIEIPRDKEKEYFQKFVTRIVERYNVYPMGFEIRSIHTKPKFSLFVKDHETSFTFRPEVRYGDFKLPLLQPGEIKAFFEASGDSYLIFRVVRDTQAEQRILQFLEGIHPNRGSLTAWDNVQKQKGLKWLSDHTAAIRAEGIRIIQDNPEQRINLSKPEIVMSTQESGDWFDVRAVVKIGTFEIPFIKFRTHILRNRREFKLPDGSIAILPDEWFSDYQHLLEVSEKHNEDTLRLRKYQAPLLQLAHLKRENLPSLDALQGRDRVPEVTPPQHLKATLRKYQSRGYDWLVFLKTHGMGGILADDMGLGKTLQTLSLLQHEKETGNETASLIIMPTSLVYNWKSEARKFTPQLKVHIHTGVNRVKDPQKFVGYDLILSTYGIVRQDVDMLRTYPFHYVILDEGQMIKNPESKTAQAIRKLTAHHRLSLTGTPVENSVMDIWSQMAFLNPGLLGGMTFFKKFYVTPIEKERDESRSEKLKRIIYPFILRRKKDQVETELPPKVEKVHYCEMDEVQEEFYEETRNTYRNYLMELLTADSWKSNKLNILAGLQKLRQIAIHPRMVDKKYKLSQSGKFVEIKRSLEEVIEKGSKVLIFSQFVKMLHLMETHLKKEGIRYNYLDGGTRNRQEVVDSFQADEDIRVFLISLKAGGVGLNLTAADYVFILDPWWNPAVENQAIDRSHRIGQKKAVFYYKFITTNSIEEKILRLQERKSQLSDDIISVEEEVYKSLNVQDFQELLGA